MGATWLGRIYDEHGRALLVERGQRVLLDEEGNRTSESFAPAGMFATIFRERDWNDYRIVAIGERIAVFVNGTLFSELVDRDAKQKDLAGQLAFQLHSGPATRVEFRQIELQTLDPDDDRLGDFQLQPEAEPDPELDWNRCRWAADGTPLNLDFESGDLTGWTTTGDAFDGQPVAADTIGQRWAGQTSNKQGKYFIGGYELSRSDAPAGHHDVAVVSRDPTVRQLLDRRRPQF